MTDSRRVRLFLDSNVLTSGVVSAWGVDKAVLSLCASRICQLVLAEVVRAEVEDALSAHSATLSKADAAVLFEGYRRLIQLTRPEVVAFPPAELVYANRHLIRHESDVPVLLSAMSAKPDWLLTKNAKHFTQAVAQRTGLRIASPSDFFKTLSSLLR